ncbi:TetR/AcrR family transcriptional regulator [Agrobacterium rhizogenes]|jgi:AcrR family transcriptional regulator|uniref:TetR family transcriptional regulator n=1 Tax=Rhizobium rhizogenes NBRC 13257 TaxID=1220581 RepID=A0AA87QEX9_RHIRH|nr:TetR/AcrR family transcriptional regulator [Rhizobium rhizogenes]OCJ00003.1 TetR family transcriptional regulator [Agrobacterium sp. 13-626]KEA04547.1 TetR family transcriptional regulator [Rhizobium rhizogenes]MQB34931.1 TetR/AcrR family transcriptional regulator [Rhizobium rhizogenes]NTF52660.1 TetR/AcrR family transcriptional regulator [Rhizobium rhizogenes]NTF59190.1 TetR/AcrR family transcriptional regulator [Rhizobium rhizogenes]
MTARGRGRPPAGEKTVLPESILSEALSILNADGLDGLSMRTLATRVGINPMTIYYHFKDRDGLIKSLAEWIYADVAAPETGDALARARSLLTAYYAKVVLYPALTLAIFARPAVFPDHAKRITRELMSFLSERNHSSQRSSRWTHILVDYTHGAALAVATQDESTGLPPRGAMLDDFESGLDELLEAFRRSSDHPSV